MTICILGGGFIARNLQKHFGVGSRVVERDELDLTQFDKVRDFFDTNTFDHVILSATVGGSRLKEDPLDTVEQNLRMYTNVKTFYKTFIWFSSGAPVTTRYGYSKHLQELLTTDDYCLRIYNCFGDDELPTRFISTCKREKHVVIDADRRFDFFHVKHLAQVVEYIMTHGHSNHIINMVYPEKYKLSEIAKMLGATCTINGTSENDYIGEYNLPDGLKFTFSDCLNEHNQILSPNASHYTGSS